MAMKPMDQSQDSVFLHDRIVTENTQDTFDRRQLRYLIPGELLSSIKEDTRMQAPEPSISFCNAAVDDDESILTETRYQFTMKICMPHLGSL